jgi:hypothetical protein
MLSTVPSLFMVQRRPPAATKRQVLGSFQALFFGGGGDVGQSKRDTLARVGLDNTTSVRPILAQAMRGSVPGLPWIFRPGVEVSVNGFVRDSDLRPESSQRQAVQ